MPYNALFALLFTLPLLVRAQAPYALAFRHLTVTDGLSHNTVYALLQDHRGLIWIGTRYGLNRYDGYRCETYLPSTGHAGSLNGFTVLALCEDRAGNLWVGHRGAGISVLEAATGAFRPFPFEPDTALDWTTVTIRAMFQDSRGRMWIGTSGNGAVVFDSTGKRVLHLASYREKDRRLTENFVFDFAEDTRGNIWIATSGRGLHCYEAASGRVRRFDSPDAANMNSFEKSLCIDRQGRVWVGSAGSGLYGYDPTRGQFVHYNDQNPLSGSGRLSHPIVTDLTCDSAGQLWIATDGGGLNLLDPASSTVQVVRASTANGPLALNTDALYQVMFDAAGNLWVGTFNGGVNLHPAIEPPFAIHRDPLAYPKKGLRSVLALHEAADGRLWLGADGGGLFYAEKPAEQSALLPARFTSGSPAPRAVTCLAPAGNGELWVGAFAGGLSRYDPQTGLLRTWRHTAGTANSLAHDNVWDLAPDDRGGLWIGTLGGGLDYFQPSSNTFRHFAPEAGNAGSLPSVQVVDVLLDRDGRYVWTASEDQGLARLEAKTGAVRRYGVREGLASPNLRCLLQDRQGALWIGTEFSGLDRLDPVSGSVRHYDTRNGLPSDIVYAVVDDAEGFLWISTQQGIVRLDPRDNSLIEFGHDPNFPQNQFNPKAALRLADGRLAFGGTQGFSVAASRVSPPGARLPHVVFTGLRLLGQSVPVGPWNGRRVLSGPLDDSTSVVQLSYSDRGIVFEFTAAEYANPAGVRYAYRLDGFDKHWIFIEAGEHRVLYSNLPGGSYRLRVKAINQARVWSAERTLRIEVRPPFWQTWWFQILLFVGVSALAYMALRFILNRQKERYEEAALKAEQEILRLKNESLEKEVQANQARLSASVLQNAHKNQVLLSLREQIAKLEAERGRGEGEFSELRRVVRAINRELDQKDYWDQFMLTFNQTHQHFIERLRNHHPEMTVNDVRLCCFVRMEMTNPEIAAILNITVNAVEQTKYRLKKKIGLEADRSLTEYIRRF